MAHDTSAPHPSTDSLGDRLSAVAAQHIDHAFRRVLRGPGVTMERAFVRLITRAPHPFGNLAVVSDPTDQPGTVAATVPLIDCGAPAAVLLPGQASAAVADHLARSGFAGAGSMPAMVVNVDALRPTALPGGYEMARVATGESDTWAQAFAAGYELPAVLGEAFSPRTAGVTTAEDAPLQYFAVVRNGRMVCTSVLYLAHGVAGIYCVSTVPEERGKGLAAHATAEPLRLARKLGYGVGVLQSSHAGHSVYLKLGFADVGELPLYVRTPA